MEEENEWERGRREGEGEGSDGDQSSVDDQVDKLEVYRNILEFLEPGETVTKVMCMACIQYMYTPYKSGRVHVYVYMS